MNSDETDTSPQMPPATARGSLLYDSRSFRWHVRVFVTANVVLSLVNVFTGRPWWAFWPFVVTGFLLAAHYLFYKANTVDERWADERVEELNLKSYDRSHIENLKTRLGDKEHPEDHPNR